MLSVLHALNYLHRQNVLHRDIKLSNILYDRYGTVKLADFGLARERVMSPSCEAKKKRPITSGTATTDDDAQLTPKVVTLWYRAPELLLGAETYTSAIDMWACGCIFAELLLREPLLPGASDMEQLDKIFRLLGRPSDRDWRAMATLPHADKIQLASSSRSRASTSRLPSLLPDLSPKGLDLLQQLLTYDPERRLTVRISHTTSYRDLSLTQRMWYDLGTRGVAASVLSREAVPTGSDDDVDVSVHPWRHETSDVVPCD
jgi:serine/threonine protein kinase